MVRISKKIRSAQLSSVALIVMALAAGCQQNSERVQRSHWSNGQTKEEWLEIRVGDRKEWQRDGLATAFYESGRERESGNYLLNQRSGVWRFWYDMEGRPPHMRGAYVAGEMDGVWEYWMMPMHHGASHTESDSNKPMVTAISAHNDSTADTFQPKPHKRESYRNGKADGLWINWHSERQVADSAFYIAGKLEGKVVAYYPSGALSSESHYQAGALVGEVKIWSEDGVRIK